MLKKLKSKKSNQEISQKKKEIGGEKGPETKMYCDWEK